ncbi:sulfite reductase flavoprotein subunit alpha [Mycolicibacterium sp. CH28]|uniref:diflavin oxidoreductase n=1 Tax=Mycolicibacterium sp. CH28 TaxID=2512237 RepID=UPI001081959E|nr:sulfite reductase flavoprotein subunit alpha [Mycolicibacterium sp. CH28]TGD88065.1 sulfite reductase flavoprotein subunit alpha [Mycolicibacterium sp. CH28]
MADDTGFSLIIGYGSDMGTAEYLAMQLADAAKAAGIEVTETELNDISLDEVQSATHFIVVTSTFGDGEVPDNGAVFWEELCAASPDLGHLHYTVLALGDSSYDLFCNAGRIIDARLAELGGRRLAERVEFDCYREGDARQWLLDITKLLVEVHTATPERAVPTTTDTAAPPRRQIQTPWAETNPYPATVLANRVLTAPDSDKEVRHLELDLADSGISYATGDSVAVHPVNDPGLVEAVLDRLGVDENHRAAGAELPLGELLTHHLEIRTPSHALQALVAARTRDTEAAAVLRSTDPAALSSWLFGRDVVDLLECADLDVDEVLDTLRPLQFRDYSIASSPLVHPDRLHLTVAAVRYRRAGRPRGGVASTFLADRGESVRIHLRPNHHFRLPAPDVPIIMVGPGTGIAPFRAFLQERRAAAAPGKNWLFFGDRHRGTDFLYGDELQAYLDSGTLTRLDLAFSRDGEASKCYVQHRMKDSAAELFGWLEAGAHLYVCGDAEKMAKDVDQALHEIISAAGGLDTAAAHAYVNELIKSHRYLRDVY